MLLLRRSYSGPNLVILVVRLSVLLMNTSVFYDSDAQRSIAACHLRDSAHPDSNRRSDR